MFAAFAFADRKSLGFDPTITRAPRNPKEFIITVHDSRGPRRFRTTGIISSSGAEPLRGRGTRVFEAIEIDENDKEKGSPVVLKDIWIHRDRLREGEILAQLYEEADEDDKKLVKKYFLTTLCHGDVFVEPDVRDDTENLMRGLETSPDSVFELQEESSMDSRYNTFASGSRSLSAINRIPDVPHPNLTYSPKMHYRIVFEENGETIDSLRKLPDVMKILGDIVAGMFSLTIHSHDTQLSCDTALQLLKKLKWVHRDVSVGNILSCKEGGKLADLEYAMQMGNMASHEMRTASGIRFVIWQHTKCS